MRAPTEAVAAAIGDTALKSYERDPGNRKALRDADALVDALRRRGWALVPLPGEWGE